MKRFIRGSDRNQRVLFPVSLDESISENNPVRVIDAFVEGLDLKHQGFDGVTPSRTGRAGYHPSTLLKLYIYGYLNWVQSSRRLERECQRNVELMWLLGELAPDHKTISEFRRKYGAAITQVNAAFVQVCRRLGLLSTQTVAIDGSKFKAVNNRDKNFTPEKMKYRQARVEKSIAKYLAALEKADREAVSLPAAETERLQARLAKLHEEMQRLEALKVQMDAAPDRQLSLTDADARSMKCRGGGTVGYNVQTAVDSEHHLIVAHEVINTGIDRGQLSGMAIKAKEALHTERLEVVADRGYFEGEQLRACQTQQITAYVPRPQTSSNLAKGWYGKRDFIYKPEDDEYECPAGERLIYRFSRQERGKLIHRYWSSACTRCTIKTKCTTGQYRRVSRWEHEATLDEVEARLQSAPEKMQLRRQTVEHPFGTIKAWMGATHFLTRGFGQVRTEMSLNVLAYNLKRVINLLGVGAVLETLRA